MTTDKRPGHVVVDGSNIATEGRSVPSLAQLSEAVMGFMEEHPDATVTVVVDATFGHRIDKKEVKEFEEGISNNELVAPPAGAIGRGDAFVLSIAEKAHASILSNDSFQEFHADYEWLFDEGRLIGGKPVPHVGWVFVNRSPVRGPVSRKATQGTRSKGSSRRESKQSGSTRGRSASRSASEPMPVPKSPPPGPVANAEEKAGAKADEKSGAKAGEKAGAKAGEKAGAKAGEKAGAKADEKAKRGRGGAPRGGDPVNELLPFLEFVEHHPVGTSINGTVESYSSHGAYIAIGDQGVRGYVPLRLMADPVPTSARKVMRLGEAVTLVVVSFAPARRSIDCAVPDIADEAIADAQAEAEAEEAAAPSGELAADEKPTRRAAAKKAPAKKAGAKKAAAKKTVAKKAPAKKAPAKKSAATKKKAPAKVAAKKTVAKKTVAKSSSASKRTAAKKPAAKRTAAKKAPAKKTAATKKKAPAKAAPVKRSAATKKKTATKKSAANKTAAKKAVVAQPDSGTD
jgi:hypothetical protein